MDVENYKRMQQQMADVVFSGGRQQGKTSTAYAQYFVEYFMREPSTPLDVLKELKHRTSAEAFRWLRQNAPDRCLEEASRYAAKYC